MSKPVKAMMRRELARRLEGAESLTVLSLAGVDGVTSNRLRREMLARDVRLTVVKNSIARQALKEVGLDAACELIEGPCTVASGGTSVVELVRDLLAFAKEAPALVVRGAFMEGELFGPDRVEELSKYPTRTEAIGNVVMLALSPAGRVVGAALSPGGRIAGALKTLAEAPAEN